MAVGITEDKIWKPQSQSVNVLTEHPYTLWVRDDDVDDWNRKPNEVYTIVILDKAAKQVLIVDRFTYTRQRYRGLFVYGPFASKWRTLAQQGL